MKRLMTFVIIGLLSVSAGADDVVNSEVVQKVISIPELTKEQVYSQSKQWMAINFKSANEVIQLDDKDNGVIIGKDKP